MSSCVIVNRWCQLEFYYTLHRYPINLQQPVHFYSVEGRKGIRKDHSMPSLSLVLSKKLHKISKELNEVQDDLDNHPSAALSGCSSPCSHSPHLQLQNECFHSLNSPLVINKATAFKTISKQN